LNKGIALRSQLEPLTLEEAQVHPGAALQLAAAEGYSPDLFPLETISRHLPAFSRNSALEHHTVAENAADHLRLPGKRTPSRGL